ncbi:MAG TPA: Xaa-Pro peptidase family protein [Anaerolineae bacterium]
MRLTESFYRRKLTQCQAELDDANLDGLVLFNPAHIYYLIGFFHFPTERTIAAWIPRSGEPVLFLPKLEEDHAASSWVHSRHIYFEYLGPPHPVNWIGETLAKWGYNKSVIGYESGLGVRTLERLQASLPLARWSSEGGVIVSRMRQVKDDEEIALIRKASEFSDKMVEAGAQAVRKRGLLSEIEINQIVMQSVVRQMMSSLNEIVDVGSVAGGLVCAGPRAAYPHGLPSLARPRMGDCLILSFGCSVGGYHAESERTFFIGEPSKAHRTYYDTVRRAQEAGIDVLWPSNECRTANKVCLDVLRDAGYSLYIKHRMGHGLGLEGHEPPWLEDGDPTPLRAGMVVSAEPGLYVPGLGGYRISDTVLVTRDGPVSLTRYPRDIESMILEVKESRPPAAKKPAAKPRAKTERR